VFCIEPQVPNLFIFLNFI